MKLLGEACPDQAYYYPSLKLLKAYTALQNVSSLWEQETVDMEMILQPRYRGVTAFLIASGS